MNSSSHEIILINVSGRDQAGITTRLTEILGKYDITVLDIGQSIIHDNLSLGMLIDVQSGSASGQVFKELLFKGYELKLNIQFTPISMQQYESWVSAQGRPRHIVTLLGREISAKHLSQVSAIVVNQGCNIDQITRLSGRKSLSQAQKQHTACIQLSLSGEVSDVANMHAALLNISQSMHIDIAVQEDNLYHRSRKLVCFDMDSTLIQAEVIDELAKVANVGEQVAEITESAMRGEIDFSESFRRRMALLEGLDEGVLQNIAKNLPITEGAERLILNLKRCGYKVAILSGGFTYFANYLKQKLGIDYVYANELDFANGKLSGKVKGDIVDGAMKAKLLKELAQKEQLSLEQVIAVGDGANDLPMLSIAGLGIAFHAKPIVKEQAQQSISTLGLDAILYLLGMRDREISQLQ